MDNIIKFASHREVRDELIEMQKCGGAMIMPFTLIKLFYELASDEEDTPNKKVRARNGAYFFCALCNEYWLFYFYDKRPNTEFFILDDRWEKYFISDSIKSDAIEFLQSIYLIACGIKEIAHHDKPVTTYQINLEMLQACRRSVREIYDQERASRKPF